MVKEIHFGAIENGREHLRRLVDHYEFECEGGSLRNCVDYQEAVRCFERLVNDLIDAVLDDSK